MIVFSDAAIEIASNDQIKSIIHQIEKFRDEKRLFYPDRKTFQLRLGKSVSNGYRELNESLMNIIMQLKVFELQL